jgi:ubiquinone/menaquinone biosynthesis C-methylase UbiE
MNMREFFEKVRERSWKIYKQYYGNSDYKHHNARYREDVFSRLGPEAVILDAGAGELGFTREVASMARLAIATDMGEINRKPGDPPAFRGNLEHIPLKDSSIDLVISMAVVEHLDDPTTSFREMARVLKSGGVFIAQTPSKYDYVSLIAHLTPHWFHRWLLSRLLDRREEDIFPTCFKANTREAMLRCLAGANLKPIRVTFFNQYPAYLMFWPLLFRVGIGFERLTSRYECFAQLRGWILVVAEKT